MFFCTVCFQEGNRGGFVVFTCIRKDVGQDLISIFLLVIVELPFCQFQDRGMYREGVLLSVDVSVFFFRFFLVFRVWCRGLGTGCFRIDVLVEQIQLSVKVSWQGCIFKVQLFSFRFQQELIEKGYKIVVGGGRSYSCGWGLVISCVQSRIGVGV